MIDDFNDPLITAYALGELDGQEAEAMKDRIEKDPVLKKHVEDIQATARVLETELGAEEKPRLAVSERESIFAGVANRPARRGFLWMISGGVLAAAAASVIAFTVLVPRATMEDQLADLAKLPPAATEIARVETPPPPPREIPGTREAKPSLSKDKSSAGPVSEEADAMAAYAFDESVSESAAVEESLAEGLNSAAPAEARGRRMEVAQGNQAQPKKMMAPTSGSAIGGGTAGLGKGGFGGAGMYMAQMDVDASMNTEAYKFFEDNKFKAVAQDSLSTFSTDVDTASYANMRRYLIGGNLPPKDAVRTEELINYFNYSYPQPTDGKPFSVTTEVAAAPWNSKHQLVRIGLKGLVLPQAERKGSNLVFLLDVSGSMNDANKLPLVQKSMKLLVENLNAKDRVSIVVYAGATGVVLSSTAVSEKSKIMAAIDELQAGGGTDGASGIELAYKEAAKHFIKGGNNRVILATDGDFNIGHTSEGELTRLIQEKAKSGVFLSVLGFGMGNYKDSTMQALANKGNGNHAYIDSLREAKKVLVEQAGGTLHTIAKDVKIQVEFNPKFVQQYRLIGYEKRMLAHQDFNDDKKDAGEIGEGHTVTALYEVIPVGVAAATTGSVDALKYQTPKLEATGAGAGADEMMTVKLRYKKPDGDKSQLIEKTVPHETRSFESASSDMKFAASVAGFAMILRDSEFKGDLKLSRVQEIAGANTGGDDYRKEFVELIKKARTLDSKK